MESLQQRATYVEAALAASILHRHLTPCLIERYRRLIDEMRAEVDRALARWL